MSSASRPIFRHDALRHYTGSREKAVVLETVRPRLFYWLWGVLAVLLAALVFLATTKVPLHSIDPRPAEVESRTLLSLFLESGWTN